MVTVRRSSRPGTASRPARPQTLRRLLGPGPDREDLLQEVFFRFFKRIGTLREPAAVRGFLARDLHPGRAGEIASRSRRRWLHLTPTGEAPDTAVPGPDVEARDTIARYYALLGRAGRAERSIFVARTIEKLTLAEVAEAHGVSISTAQRRLARATKRIAALVRSDPALMRLAEWLGGGRTEKSDEPTRRRRSSSRPSPRRRGAWRSRRRRGVPRTGRLAPAASSGGRRRAVAGLRWWPGRAGLRRRPARRSSAWSSACTSWRSGRALTYDVGGGAVEESGYIRGAGDAGAAVRFSDGTRIDLAAGARMSVVAPGPHGARLRVEEGQAHFSVMHLPHAAWSVEAGPYVVEVTGTVFDVRWSSADEVAEVRLRIRLGAGERAAALRARDAAARTTSDGAPGDARAADRRERRQRGCGARRVAVPPPARRRAAEVSDARGSAAFGQTAPSD